MKKLLLILLFLPLISPAQEQMSKTASDLERFMIDSFGSTAAWKRCAIETGVLESRMALNTGWGVTANNWDSDTALYLMAGNSLNELGVNAKSLTKRTTGGHYAIWNNAPTAGKGFVGPLNGTTQSLDASLFANALPQNDNHLSVQERTANLNTEFYCGTATGAPYQTIGYATGYVIRNNSAGAITLTQTITTPAHLAAVRTNGTQINAYHDGIGFTIGTGNPYALVSSAPGADKIVWGQALGLFTTISISGGSVGVGSTWSASGEAAMFKHLEYIKQNM